MHSLPLHSPVGGSGMGRWHKNHCPGSVAAAAHYANLSSYEAEEGTAAHELAQTCLLVGLNAIDYHGHLFNNISVDDDAGDTGSVTIAGDVRLGASITIDTEAGNSAGGGFINLANASVSATAAGTDLTLNTATTNGADSGGNVSLGLFTNTGNNFINDLGIDTSSAGGAAGALTLNNDISLDDDGAAGASSLTVTGNGDIIIAAVAVPADANANNKDSPSDNPLPLASL